MKKSMKAAVVSCLLLGITFASCKSTRETVPAQSAATDDPTITIPADDVADPK